MKIFVFILCMLLLSIWLSIKAWGQDFNVPGGQELSDAEMDDFRGKYAEFYFTVDFSGTWTPSGGNADLIYSGNVNPSNPDTLVGADTSTVFASRRDTDVRATATVGDLYGARGIMQISLVPGNNNVVNNRMNIYLTVINVMDTSQIAGVRDALSLR